ncbi:hypothetical protein Ahy_A03g011677 isoform C [Arachis hypogaea]|uniref:Aspergillus nuclease S1 n=1 Tax=Arachis hypogaea TaxID=3818 RepID=A0A445DRK2_ARAHY|nr:hypothetical protein Ahy_A03g011677 isoform C [Arachis hypogaea]
MDIPNVLVASQFSAGEGGGMRKNPTLICAPVMADSVDKMHLDVSKAKASGADLVEIRLDSLKTFNPSSHLPALINNRPLPLLFTYRPNWEGGMYEGDDNTRFHALRLAMELGADYIDIELKVANQFYDFIRGTAYDKTKVIVSSHNYQQTPSVEDLGDLAARIQATGADIVKIATTALEITDVARMFQIMVHSQVRSVCQNLVNGNLILRCKFDFLQSPYIVSKYHVPVGLNSVFYLLMLNYFILFPPNFKSHHCYSNTPLVLILLVPFIGLVMGDRGLISRILCAKFGGYLTFGTLESGVVSAPGQPTLKDLLHLYNLRQVGPDTKVFGIIGKPVGHSKSPTLFNEAFKSLGINGVYVFLLVDDLAKFLSTYSSTDFVGFSVTIPHKEAAVTCCDEVDPVAKSIGAVNCIIRRPDGKLIGGTVVSPLAGKLFVVIGAGGAGKALAYGAKEKGARVVIANRTYERARELADLIGGDALALADLDNYHPEDGMILANTTSIGMQPKVDETPVSKHALKYYSLVFDAVYTPKMTRLLTEAEESGATVVTGLEMFLGQAYGQFEKYTGMPEIVRCWFTDPRSRTVSSALLPAPASFQLNGEGLSLGRTRKIFTVRSMSLLIVSFVVGVVLFPLPTALCWGKDGHYAVCKIAQDYLNQDAVSAVKELLPDSAQGHLAAVCSWADDVGYTHNYRWSQPLHYVDTPDFICNYRYCSQSFHLCSNSFCFFLLASSFPCLILHFAGDCHDSYAHKHVCVTAAIYNYTMQLKSQLNYNLTEALMFLSHFVGDVHQPLHVGFLGDLGGNTITVRWYRRKTNLHHVWDDIIIESALKTFYGSDLSTMIQAIQSNITDIWLNDVRVWESCAHNYTACPNWYASESISLACKFAYRNATPGSTLEDR